MRNYNHFALSKVTLCVMDISIWDETKRARPRQDRGIQDQNKTKTKDLRHPTLVNTGHRTQQELLPLALTLCLLQYDSLFECLLEGKNIWAILITRSITTDWLSPRKQKRPSSVGGRKGIMVLTVSQGGSRQLCTSVCSWMWKRANSSFKCITLLHKIAWAAVWKDDWLHMHQRK